MTIRSITKPHGVQTGAAAGRPACHGRGFPAGRLLAALAGIVGALGGAAANPCLAAEGGDLAGRRPNVILILTDDQGYGDLSCHGNPVLKTPSIDRLHARGVRFVDFHVSPTCSPTRSALLTGRHEFRNGVTHTILERERLAPGAVTLADVLRGAGYATGIFGKWHLGDEPEYWPNRRGFDEMFIHGAGGIGQSYPGSCGDAPGNTYFDPVLLHNGKFVKTRGYCTDLFFDQALRWIDAVRGTKPFFCYIATNTPHDPLQVRPEDEARYTGQVSNPSLAKFFGMIANIDDNVGRLLARLEDWGIDRQTLVVFMNDNGGTLGVEVFNAGMRGAKNTPWLGGTRASSLWYWPGTLAPADVRALSAHIDVFPTMAALAGARQSAAAAAQVEGRSLLPLLQNPGADWPDRMLFTHVGRWPKGADRAQYQYAQTSVRTTRWHLVSAAADRRKAWQLFDVAADPGETTDLAATHAEVVAQLDEAHTRWWQSVQPQLVNEEAAGPAENPYRALYREQFGAGALRQPDVLFILADDQRHDTVGRLGQPQIVTPWLDSLVDRGFVFHNAYCQGSMISAVCAPSRTMLLTGRSLFRIPRPDARDYDGATLGAAFRRAGYATLYVGKPGNGFRLGNEAFETFVYTNEALEARAQSSQETSRAAIGWLARQPADRPVFMLLAPPVPHDPRVAPPEFMRLYDPARIALSKNFMPEHPFDNGDLRVRDELLADHPRDPAAMRRHLADYYATITCLDHHMGRVFEAFRAAGRDERTLVVYTSDQGLAVGGRHGLMGKQNLYEHVKPPLILAGPGIPHGQSSALVYLFDLFPTLCELAGVDRPQGLEGQSLAGVLKGHRPLVRERLFAAYKDSQRMLRDERFKLLWYPQAGRRQLFDLQRDPFEVEDLSPRPEFAATLAALVGQLAEAQREFNDPLAAPAR